MKSLIYCRASGGHLYLPHDLELPANPVGWDRQPRRMLVSRRRTPLVSGPRRLLPWLCTGAERVCQQGPPCRAQPPLFTLEMHMKPRKDRKHSDTVTVKNL